MKAPLSFITKIAAYRVQHNSKYRVDLKLPKPLAFPCRTQQRRLMPALPLGFRCLAGGCALPPRLAGGVRAESRPGQMQMSWAGQWLTTESGYPSTGPREASVADSCFCSWFCPCCPSHFCFYPRCPSHSCCCPCCPSHSCFCPRCSCQWRV